MAAGLNMEDFRAMPPARFRQVLQAVRERDDRRERTVWEAARAAAVLAVQPHVRQRLTPAKVLPLPWDGQGAEDAKAEAHMTAEQLKARAAEFAAKHPDNH